MTEKKSAAKCKHSYMVTRSMTKGGSEKAIEVRCIYCLEPVNLEELSCLEWKKSEGMS
jgi:hypothetical protein